MTCMRCFRPESEMSGCQLCNPVGPVVEPQPPKNMSVMPTWKKGATAYERLMELALLARAKPEQFEAFVLVYRGTTPRATWRTRTHAYAQGDANIDYERQVGILYVGMEEIITSTER